MAEQLLRLVELSTDLIGAASAATPELQLATNVVAPTTLPGIVRPRL